MDEVSHRILEDSAREVLETSAATAVVSATHSAEADRAFAEMIATISLNGTRGGTLVVYCLLAQAQRIAARMLGEDDVCEDTVRDAVGELVNQIGGTIKRRIGASGGEIMLSVPVVVSGSPLAHCVKAPSQPMTVKLALAGDEDLCVCFWQA